MSCGCIQTAALKIAGQYLGIGSSPGSLGIYSLFKRKVTEHDRFAVRVRYGPP